MAETFYTALGVGSDADPDAIQTAYRERVKQRHPDVSDDPGAPREFQRLTTARDVLTDDAERDRYDRLGHATYVQRHLETSAWGAARESGVAARDGDRAGERAASPDESTATAAETRRDSGSDAGQRRHRASRTQEFDRSAWLGNDWERPDGADRRRRARAGTRTTASAGGASANADWQHASEAYRYQPSSVPTQRPNVASEIWRHLRSLGPWLLVHLIFVGSAIGTVWYGVATTSLAGEFSVPAMAVGILLVSLALLLSVLHLVSLIFS